MSFLRIYSRCFSLATDLDDTVEEQLLVGDRPKVCDTPESKLPLKDRLPMRKEEELNEVRPASCLPLSPPRLAFCPFFDFFLCLSLFYLADCRRARAVRLRDGAVRVARAVPRPRAAATGGRPRGGDEAARRACWEGEGHALWVALWDEFAEDERAQEAGRGAACGQGGAGVCRAVL